MSQGLLDLSIVIPAYNEEKRLAGSLARIHEWLMGNFPAPKCAEVIVVDDGSTDGTSAVVSQLCAVGRYPELRLVQNGANRGKGYSVRHGVLEARGRTVLFTDADLSAPIEEGEKLLAALGSADVAIGSRAVDRRLIEVHQPFFRETAGRIFNFLVWLFTGVPFADTQCGFKAFRLPECRIVFEQQRIERFGFDPEILYLARRHGLRAVEIPVRWAHDPATKVHVVRDSLRMFGDLMRIRANALRGRYPRRQRG